MHELSIIQEVVAAAAEAAREAGAIRVHTVTLRVGALAGVVKDSLLFCYDVASEGTLLAGSRLEIEEVPVVIHCAQCQAERELQSVLSFRCPVCGSPGAEIRQGRELELTRIELEEA